MLSKKVLNYEINEKIGRIHKRGRIYITEKREFIGTSFKINSKNINKIFYN